MALTDEELSGFNVQAKPAAADIPKLDRVQVQANSGLSQEEIEGFKPSQPDLEVSKENLSLSYGVDSDAIIEQKRKQKELGLNGSSLLSPDAVNKAHESKQREAFRNSFDEKKNPRTAAIFSDKSNSDVAWEDKDNFAEFERLTSEVYKKNLLHKGYDVGKAFVEGVQEKGFVDFSKALKDRFLVDAGYSHLIGTFGTMRAQSEIGEQSASLFGIDIKNLQRNQMEFMASLFGEDKEKAAAWYESITADSSGLGSGLYKNQGAVYQAKSDKLKQMTDFKSPEVNAVLEAAGSAGTSTAASIPTAVARKNPLTLLSFGNLVFGQSYAESRDKYGLGIGDSLLRASLHAGSEVGSEFLSLPLWDKVFKGGDGAKAFVELTAGEAATESMSTIGANYTDWLLLPQNEDKSFTEFLAEQPADIAETVKMSLLSTPMSYVGGKALSVPSNYVRDTLDNRALKKNREAVAKIIQGENDQKIIDKSIELSQNSLTFERDPELLEKFVSNLQEEQRDLYVPADIVKDIIDLPDYMANQIDGLGGDVVIPMSKFMSDVARNEQLMTAIRPHLTLRESGESLYSIEKNGDNAIRTMLDEAKRVIQEKDDIDQGYENIKQQLIDTGVLQTAEADANATLVKEYVQRVSKERGVTIPEAYDYLRLKIAKPNESIEAKDVIDQDPLQSAKSQGYEGEDIGESKEWLAATKKFGKEGMTKEARMARAKESGWGIDNKVFHVSKTSGLKEFNNKFKSELSALGFHFGTKEQAETRAGHNDFIASQSRNYGSSKASTGEYYLRVKNPLRVNHMESFAPDHLAEKLMDMDLLGEEAYASLSEKHDYNDVKIGNALVKILKKAGYDGLVYANEREGSGDSFVPFDTNQIRSTSAAFDPDYKESANILMQPKVEPSTEDLLKELTDAFKGKDVTEMTAVEFEEYINQAFGILDEKNARKEKDVPVETSKKVPRETFQGKEDKGFIGWSEERIQNQISYAEVSHDDRSKAQVVYINPIDFVYATTSDPQDISDRAGNLDMDKLREEVDQTPFLYIEDGKITGHEGRHRMMALAKAGYTRVPIVIEDRSYDKEKYKSDEEAFAVGDSVTVEGQYFGKEYEEQSGKTEPITFEAGRVLMRKNKKSIVEDMSRAKVLFQPNLNKLPEITRKIIGKNDLLLAYTLLAQNDESFQLPISEKKDLVDIFNEVVGGMKIKEMGGSRKASLVNSWAIVLPNYENAYVYQDGKTVWIDVSKSLEGQKGKEIYNAVANFAFNNGFVFRGDPAGLSKEAQSRRLENMISSALKFGTTDHLWPHDEQLKTRAGVPAIKWKDGDDAHNLEQMILASYEFVKKQFPEISNLIYDYKTDQFIEEKTGEVWDEKQFNKLATIYNEKPSDVISGKLPKRKRDSDGNPVTAGRTTLERAVFTHTFSRPESSKEERRRLLAKIGEFGSKRLEGVFYQSQPTNITTPEQLADKLNPSKERETSLLQKKLNQVEALSNCLKKG